MSVPVLLLHPRFIYMCAILMRVLCWTDCEKERKKGLCKWKKKEKEMPFLDIWFRFGSGLCFVAFATSANKVGKGLDAEITDVPQHRACVRRPASRSRSEVLERPFTLAVASQMAACAAKLHRH